MSGAAPPPPGLEAPRRASRHQVADVVAMVRDTSARLAAWPEHAAAGLAPYLAAAQRDVAKALNDWVTNIPDGNLRFTAQRYAGTLLQLQGARAAVARLAPETAGQMAGVYPLMARDSLEAMRSEYARMYATFGGGQLAPRLDLDTARIVTDRENLLISRFESSAQRYAGQVFADIQGELVKGILANETYSELIERLVRIGGPATGAAGEVIAEGLFKRYRYWAHRLVRTELQHAANLTLDEGIRRLALITPGLERRWDASVDGRICALCFELDGTTAPIDGFFADGIETAPAHPNCRCRVGAWRPEWSTYLEWMREVQ